MCNTSVRTYVYWFGSKSKPHLMGTNIHMGVGLGMFKLEEVICICNGSFHCYIAEVISSSTPAEHHYFTLN